MTDEQILPDSSATAEQGAEDAVAETVDSAASELEQAQQEAARYRDQALRALADTENVRKRARRDVEDARRGAKDDFVRELLPVFDNVARALQSAQQTDDVKSVAEGLEMVLRQFEGALERSEIRRVPTVGGAFDPSVHEAISQLETDEQPPGTILNEVLAGYTHGERLLRAAMVVVAKPKA